MHKIYKKTITLFCYALLGISLLSAVNYQTHTVRKGDNLYNLAKRYGVKIEQIKELSNITNNKLHIGQELIIREEETKSSQQKETSDAQTGDDLYVVERGDNLSRIARRYDMTVGELKDLNDLTSDKLFVGQKLKIKAEKPQPTPKQELPDEQTGEDIYVVKRGDNLSRIAKRHDMTVGDLTELNNLTSDQLAVGQKLKIKPEEPTPAEKKKVVQSGSETSETLQEFTEEVIDYVVKRNDNLSRIAKNYETTVKEIKSLNNLKSTRLSVGQKLKIMIKVPKPKKKKEPAVKTPAVKDTTSAVKKAAVEVRRLTIDEFPDDYIYVVKPKDNLYRIALNHKIDLKDLLEYNDFESDDTVIAIGQKIIVKDPSALQPVPVSETQPVESAADTADQELRPASKDSVVIEKYYIVQRKDNLYRIAKENGITVEELKRLNNLKNNRINPGQKLYIVAPKGTAPDQKTSDVTEEDLKTKSVIRTDLIMPVEGKVISDYGIRNGRPHKGIDLGASAGMPVFAVLDGTVVYSGLQGNYGNVVVIEHPEYVMTVYAHNEKNIVSVGDIVKQGQIIATVGSTGNATAPHVHFEYRIKGKAINPHKVLPLGK